MKIYGHRGAAGLVLENTVASIKKAIALGVDGVEFDVRTTKDGKAVIIHDETLERTHKKTGKIAKLTLSEIQNLIKKHPFPVPSLEQLLLAIGKKTPANVELKEIAAVAPTLRILTTSRTRVTSPSSLTRTTSSDTASPRTVGKSASAR